MKVKEEAYVTRAEAKKILSSKEKELGYEQKNALEFLHKFAKLSAKDIEEFRNALEAISKLNDKQKTLIMDFLPKNEDELNILFANEIITLSADEKKKIIEITKKFA